MFKTLLALVGAVFFFMPVAQASDWPQGEKYNHAAGTRVTLSASATQEAFNFGFKSKAVQMCFVHDTTSPVYYRIGASEAATTSATFIAGGGAVGADNAAILTAAGDGTDTNCKVYPLEVRGIVFHSTGNSTVDVSAFR